MDQIVILSDPAVNDFGPTRPPYILAKALAKRGFNVKFVSPIVSEKIRNELLDRGVELYSFDVPKIVGGSSKRLLFFWIMESLANYLNSKLLKLFRKGFFRKSFIINFSNIFHSPSHIWYAQGIFSRAFKEIDWSDWPFYYNIAAYLAYPLVRLLDLRHVSKMNAITKVLVANSRFSASMYRDLGFRVDAVIYPPVDLNTFKPAKSNPRGDYVLTYIGKETDFKSLKILAKLGVNIVGFGGKERYVPSKLMKEKNYIHVGKVSNNDLVELYSNALFTFFPFTHEPFGYIPVESMACGTPVLTYDREGPSEVVKDNVNGWVVEDRRELLKRALEIWKNGYPRRMRYASLITARRFDSNKIAKIWLSLIDRMLLNGLPEIRGISYLYIWREIVKIIYKFTGKVINGFSTSKRGSF